MFGSSPHQTITAFFSLIAPLVLRLSCATQGPILHSIDRGDISLLCPFRERKWIFTRLLSIQKHCVGDAVEKPEATSHDFKWGLQKQLELHFCLNRCHRLLLVIKSWKIPCKYELTKPQMRIIFTFMMTYVKFSCSDLRSQLSLDYVSVQVL